jgi:hypothetical protein
MQHKGMDVLFNPLKHEAQLNNLEIQFPLKKCNAYPVQISTVNVVQGNNRCLF